MADTYTPGHFIRYTCSIARYHKSANHMAASLLAAHNVSLDRANEFHCASIGLHGCQISTQQASLLGGGGTNLQRLQVGTRGVLI